jgi:hypothetical protein
MPPFLRIGQKYINPALITAIVDGSCFVMVDGVEVTKKKIVVHFGATTETLYGPDAEALLGWLADYSTEATPIPA